MTSGAAPVARMWSWRQGVAYGLLGMPLAYAALPLYVVLPHHYASTLGLPLVWVGVLLMAVRLMDACVEPWLGRFSDQLFRRGAGGVLAVCACAGAMLGVGLLALFFPQVDGAVGVAGWLVVGMLLTSVTHSQIVIAHQAWGVRLGGDPALRSRIVAWREGWGLFGVVSASALSVRWGAEVMWIVFASMLAVGWWAWSRAPRPPEAYTAVSLAGREATSVRGGQGRARRSVAAPLRVRAFRRLLMVFLCNGIASAAPASLMLFYAEDRLQATPSQVAVCLVLYFVSAAVSLPGWVRLVRHIGLAPAWLLGMCVSVLCFAFAAVLVQGQWVAFALICVVTGLALGADLAVPGAMLALVIDRAGGQGDSEGTYLGWWNLVSKLNLALAAGVALPLLQVLGYTPGTQDAVALQRLGWIYALLPCVLKVAAASLLWRMWWRERRQSDRTPSVCLSSGAQP